MRLRWRFGLGRPRLPWVVPAVLAGLCWPPLPAHAQVWRSVWTGSVTASAEVVSVSARIGPVMTTLVVAASPSAFVTRAAPAAEASALSTSSAAPRPTPSPVAIDVTAAPGSGVAVPGIPAGIPSPAAVPPVLEPTVAGEAMRAYVVTAGPAPGGPSGSASPGGAAVGAGAAVTSAVRGLVQLRDGTTGQTVLVQQPSGTGDGRLVVTVVFN